MDDHRWVGYHGVWHCRGCGDTRYQDHTPETAGCEPLADRVQAVLENPTGWTRTYLADLLRECVDRLSVCEPRP